MLTLKKQKWFGFSLCSVVMVKFGSVRHYCNIVQLIQINFHHHDLILGFHCMWLNLLKDTQSILFFLILYTITLLNTLLQMRASCFAKWKVNIFTVSLSQVTQKLTMGDTCMGCQVWNSQGWLTWLYLFQINLQKDTTSKNARTAAKKDKKEKPKGKVCLSRYAILWC